MIRSVVQYPHKALRALCRPVSLQDATLPALVADLEATVRDQEGLGLAAPQIGDDRAVFLMRDCMPLCGARAAVMEDGGEEREGGPRSGRRRGRGRRRRQGLSRMHLQRPAMEAPPVTFTPVLNPEILEASTSQSVGLEGCLSLPDMRVLVRRPDRLVVRYSLPDGTTVTEKLSGLPAVIFSHEFDHLQGVMHVDREVKTFVDRTYDEEMQHAVERYCRQLAVEFGEV